MTYQPYMIVQIILIVCTILFFIREIRLLKKDSIYKNDIKKYYLIFAIILIGIIVRTINLSYPHGVFVDEAMGAYDAWCLANYGIDSNLMSFPVYLKSWGTGQSALYAYLAIPFIKAFGLNAEIYRLPMSIIGCISLLIFYYTIRKISITKKPFTLVFFLVFFFVINPWHIIKCRFAVDCNICPDLILIGLCFVIQAYYSTKNKKQSLLYILGFSIMSISAYGYAVSWLCLPFLFIGLFFLLKKNGNISTKQLISVLISIAIVISPLILFALSLFLKWDQINLGFLTIPSLNESRHNATTLFGSEDITRQILIYLKYGFKAFFLGVDNLNVSTLPFFGSYYNIISLPFLFYGLYKGFQNKNIFLNQCFGIWLLSCLPIILSIEPTINHWNIFWFPIIYFTGYGLYHFATIARINFMIISTIYSLLFILFLKDYFNRDIYKPFNSDTFKNEVLFLGTKDFNKIYYPKDFIFSYTVFYNPIDPVTFRKTYISNGKALSTALAYDNVIFGLPNQILPKSKTAYLISNSDLQNIDLSLFRINKGIYYSVLWND